MNGRDQKPLPSGRGVVTALNSMNGFDLVSDYVVAYGVKNNCMNAAGYVWKKPPRSAKAKRPAGAGLRDK